MTDDGSVTDEGRDEGTVGSGSWPRSFSELVNRIRQERTWQIGAGALGLILLLLLLLPTFPRPLQQPDGGLHIITFFQQSGEDSQQATFEQLEENKDIITYMAPFWYGVLPDGEIKDNSSDDIKEWAAENDIRLQPLVQNLTPEAQGTTRFLETPEARQRVVQQITQVVDDEDYPGISIDFQMVPDELSQQYQAFMEEIHEEMQERNKMITVNVIPHGHSQHTEDAAYHFGRLARVTDAIILMAYDYHGFGPEPGPVSPLDWVTSVVEHAVEQTGDPGGVILGVPAYGYDWTVGAGEQGDSMPLKDIQQMIQENNIEPQRREDGIPHFEYQEDGERHVVWYEDATSIKPKVELARENNLHGIAIWRAGFETQQYWSTVRDVVE